MVRPPTPWVCYSNMEPIYIIVSRIEKFAIRMCLHKWDVNYENVLEEANFPTLKNQRLYLNLCTLFKIICNLVSLLNTPYNPPMEAETTYHYTMYHLPVPQPTKHLSFPVLFLLYGKICLRIQRHYENDTTSTTLWAYTLTDFRKQLKLLLL